MKGDVTQIEVARECDPVSTGGRRGVTTMERSWPLLSSAVSVGVPLLRETDGQNSKSPTAYGLRSSGLKGKDIS
jgi:hypothetical protein